MKKIFSLCLLWTVMMVSVISCKKGKETNSPVQLKNDINLATSSTLGQYLVNKSGQTLYMFANDADGANTCTGGCEAVWPVFNADLAIAKIDDGLAASDFTSVTTASGKKQVVYKGWPLYTYAPPASDGYGGTTNKQEDPGKTGGDGANNVWFAAKPDYTIMIANKQLTGLDGKNYKNDYTIGTGTTAYFTDAGGRTIYTFTIDSFNINKFTRADFSNNPVWPLYEQDKITVPSILNKTLFGSITVFGRKQMTYKGWPLYYFGQDTQRGQNKGVSVPVAGVWPVAVKDIAEARK